MVVLSTDLDFLVNGTGAFNSIFKIRPPGRENDTGAGDMVYYTTMI
jgi:hypothetical protein